MKKRVILLTIDAWGFSVDKKQGNAIYDSGSSTIDIIASKHPAFLLKTHGIISGMTKGVAGNTQTGHHTIGAGRTDILPNIKISKAINNNVLYSKMKPLIDGYPEKVHVMGLLSDRNNICDMEKFKAYIEFCEYKSVFVHLILDGIDSKPFSGRSLIHELETGYYNNTSVQIGSVVGRNYVMREEKKTYRIEETFEVMTKGDVKPITPKSYVYRMHRRGINDADIPPALFNEEGRILPSEPLLFANEKSEGFYFLFEKFLYRNKCLSMENYANNTAIRSIIGYDKLKNHLPEVLCKAGIKQVYIAPKMEKDGSNIYLKGLNFDQQRSEFRLCVSDYPDIFQYEKITPSTLVKAAIKMIEKSYDFVLCNIPYLDHALHNDTYDVICDKVLEIDEAVCLLYNWCLENHTTLIITSPFGGIEACHAGEIDLKTEIESRKHTKNPVPFILCDGKNYIGKFILDDMFTIQDVTPTILTYLGLDVPEEMTGQNLMYLYDKLFLNKRNISEIFY
ncbi:2,3-bisphosphoglycerate-independent phosphoglycerate mutase [Edhazardia aedis USNM 41457]|uniref:phosphoglycerate mutase (2,3-diphosphoglycerate-independent) n=1 Tax=Edhazardia aedis (strain USNM 41457) TaxID=1003232 RepID=J9D1V6_EDHAE|nr:2,3-bisphosphoglycerate-independent phosphoglycerate mutase [Edhazardia aedis USNM 41457]|eukprot:EJW01544.1 2,3-bisphosphoglycerate-independent phosphoglycerate mutase [Edhazardia aedis USNM 41457]